ncbi:hypothetical protein PIB30_051539 [Stylosanthes scabra]|uniref:Uncharacterized protein n=1 Tax=Stylosanthes scabra TaxID=79078 RepID=A0ABU6VGF8_9FABA|nr:hypothetical protein [Stylosanthes scabra]
MLSVQISLNFNQWLRFVKAIFGGTLSLFFTLGKQPVNVVSQIKSPLCSAYTLHGSKLVVEPLPGPFPITPSHQSQHRFLALGLIVAAALPCSSFIAAAVWPPFVAPKPGHAGLHLCWMAALFYVLDAR